jgi:molybdopterin/thiamine biosynthesis adenylyltransferase
MKHPLLIGAGGVASYLLPVLIKSFHPDNLVIVDKDTLEKRNLDRQMFQPSQVGMSKAQALADLYYNRAQIIEDWFTIDTLLPEDIDAIICVADNHVARHAALLKSEELNVMCYLGGNEFLDSQAMVYHRDWRGTKRDPLIRYPEIATDETGSPMRCQGEAQVIHPQLAVANMGCAAKLLHLMWVYERWLPEQKLTGAKRDEVIASLPVEFLSTLSDNCKE